MSPDDPRHGTNAGYTEHQSGTACDPCKAANAQYERRRSYDAQLGRPRLVPSRGAQRRIRALQRLGWSLRMIATEAGWNQPQDLKYVLSNDSCNRRTWVRIAETYERLSMTVPPLSSATARARLRAERLGYPPPLAWDDIDRQTNPPQDWQYQPGTRADEIRDMADNGAGISQAAAHLHLSRKSLEKWCGRHGLMDIYKILAARELSGFCIDAEHGRCTSTNAACSCDCHATQEVAA